MNGENQYYTAIYWIALILPSVIAGVVSIVSLITNYRNSKSNQLMSMVFAQKEKVADQFIEKSSELIAITDPLVLNTKINEYTPTIIAHEDFMDTMRDLLSIDNSVQTLSSIIKLHTWSIYEKDTLADVGEMFSRIDLVQKYIQDMIMELIKLHSSNTEQGSFLRQDPMAKKKELERSFSESYKEPYTSMVTSITKVARILRENAIAERTKCK